MIEKAGGLVDALRQYLIDLPQGAKNTIAVTADLLGFGTCVVVALWLMLLEPFAIAQTVVVAVIAVFSVLLAWWQGMYRSVIRYMGLELLVVGARSAVGSAIVGAVLMNFFVSGVTPFRWAVAYASFSFMYVCGSRFFTRMYLVNHQAQSQREKVIIYGAGFAGIQLIMSLQSGDDYLPVAILDDDPLLQFKRVKGLEVSPPAMIESLCRTLDVKRVLLAVPSARGRSRRKILEKLSAFPVHVQTIPDIGDIVSGKARVEDLSDVDVIDLLGRDPVPANPQLLQACITGKSVMVTGAGGSIGSELCSQILALNPTRLILLEISEPALYSINRKLENAALKLGTDCEIVALLGSVHHEVRVREVLETFSVQTVYHAAAYKHVPIVEHNLFEGIHNNVFGTMHTARAAIDAGVETFVLVSTDKAVSPTSIMGATKRFAELILQAHNSREINTRFCMVRFGNVLESSGSVVPLFRDQIRNGGPVTVTHREIIRYFMTIPEAAELVIQAGSMADGGDVFVLDMGKPVRIQDLAYRMVNLMGLTVRDDDNPEGDIDIEYVGLRPAEKLYEELLIGSNVTGTRHPRIMRADEDFLPMDELNAHVNELQEASLAMDYERARSSLKLAVQEYSPRNGIDDLVWSRKKEAGEPQIPDTIVEFPGKAS